MPGGGDSDLPLPLPPASASEDSEFEDFEAPPPPPPPPVPLDGRTIDIPVLPVPVLFIAFSHVAALPGAGVAAAGAFFLVPRAPPPAVPVFALVFRPAAAVPLCFPTDVDGLPPSPGQLAWDGDGEGSVVVPLAMETFVLLESASATAEVSPSARLSETDGVAEGG